MNNSLKESFLEFSYIDKDILENFFAMASCLEENTQEELADSLQYIISHQEFADEIQAFKSAGAEFINDFRTLVSYFEKENNSKDLPARNRLHLALEKIKSGEGLEAQPSALVFALKTLSAYRWEQVDIKIENSPEHRRKLNEMVKAAINEAGIE